MLRITGLTKKLFLTALLCGCQVMNTNAGGFWSLLRWTSGWFSENLLGASSLLGQIYPGNLFHTTTNNILVLADQHVAPVDNMPVYLKYPNACIWVWQQLEQDKIESWKIQLENTTSCLGQRSSSHKLDINLAQLETLIQKERIDASLTPQEKSLLDQAQTFILHEIGHLKNRSLFISTFVAPICAIAGSKAITRATQISLSWWLNTFVKTAYSRAIVNVIEHIDEHCADSYAISHTKNSEALINTAKLFLEQQHIESCHEISCAPAFSCITWMARSHIGQGVIHWCLDTHASGVARAKRFLKHAGIQISQRELMHELNRQTETHIQQEATQNEQNEFKFDMNPILAASEKNKARAAESEKRAENFRELLTLGGYGD